MQELADVIDANHIGSRRDASDEGRKGGVRSQRSEQRIVQVPGAAQQTAVGRLAHPAEGLLRETESGVCGADAIRDVVILIGTPQDILHQRKRVALRPARGEEAGQQGTAALLRRRAAL